MQRIFIIIGLIVFVFFRNSYSQQFILEWEISQGLEYVGDIDGDGVGEFVDYDSDNFITTFYDGQNHNLKWTITEKIFNDDIFDADAMVHPAYSKFPSIDYNGDGKRELFFEPSVGEGIIIVDVVNNTNVFEWVDDQITTVDFETLSDVDGDGVLELVYRTIQYNFNFPDSNINKTYVYSTGLTTTALEGNNISSPKAYRLEQNYPNPFNPATTIRYSLTSSEKVSVSSYDASGQLVKEFINEHFQAGEYEVIWDGSNNFGEKVSSGAYFYQLTTGDYAEAKKM